MNRIFNITPQWISGFVQADGSFIVRFDKRDSGMPVRPRPTFVITQAISELPLMKAIQEHLGVGNIQIGREEVNLVVTSLADLIRVIIPLFDNHTLLGDKLNSYLVFKKVVLMMNDNAHLTLVGTLQILKLAYFTHSTSQRTETTLQVLMNLLVAKFGTLPDFPLVDKCVPVNPFSITLDWLTGLIDGDGSFNFAFMTTRRRVKAHFTIIMGLGDLSVLEAVKTYLGCGTIYNMPTQAVRFQVESINALATVLIPALAGANFNTIKQTYFPLFTEAVGILSEHGVQSDVHLRAVVELVYDMNLQAVRRKLTKQQYLAKLVKTPHT